jgi:two-component system, sensor histidine kinase RpfC
MADGRLRSRWLFLRDRLAPTRSNLLGREQGQAILRLAAAACAFVYLAAHLSFGSGSHSWLWFSLTYIVFATTVAIFTFRDRRSSRLRRLATNIADIVAITYVMATTGEIGAPLFPLYLWVTLGNGFRFGLGALFTSAALSLTGFGIVFLSTQVWPEHAGLSFGVTVALVLLPLYAAHLIRQLDTALKRADEAGAAKGHFLARMSHELRTPLNGIFGTTELLLAGRRLTQEDRSLLSVIQESVGVALQQVNNVLDFSKISAGRLVIKRDDFDLHEVINATARMVNATVREKGLRLLVRVSPNAPHDLVGDGHHLREVLLNLLSNAIKFTDSGYVALEVDCLSVSDRRTVLRFEVRDTGIGMSASALSHIFEDFRQENETTARRYGGAGLGTTIAKQLVELMYGRLGAVSVKGRGSVFWAEIPFHVAAERADRSTALSGARVLLISDDANCRAAIEGTMSPWNAQLVATDSASSAVSVLARAIRTGSPVVAVLADRRLALSPSGTNCLEELTDKAVLAQTPIYLLTDEAPPAERLRQFGYAACLPSRPTARELFRALHASPYACRTADAGVVHIEPWAWGRRRGGMRRILIADDNRTNLMILRKILERAEFLVDSASNGGDALELLVTGGYKTAIVDIHMPGMDGIGVLRKYRLLRPKSSLPIIILTANTSAEAARECADAGADAYLTKPVSSDALLATVDRLIQETEVCRLPTALRLVTRNDRAQTENAARTLDFRILKELQHLYGSPEGVTTVIEAFETDGQMLFAKLAEAVAASDHAAFSEWMHALRGSAANVGAVRLVEACASAQTVGFIDFRRLGGQLLSDVQARFDEAVKALALANRSGGHAGGNFGSDGA